ncbi:MAG: T9SS type A sorting domain-containing protein [Bacteroidetes bacterium]|nr:T9SS type A sorting domain-containing protein [Bacteroidota bacterium]
MKIKKEKRQPGKVTSSHHLIVSSSIFQFLIFLSLSLSFFTGQAQKEGNIWVFPDSLGIDFNDTVNPVTFTSKIGPSPLGLPGGNQTTIADSIGSLFCYAAATEWSFHALYVWDRNHNVMPNGHNLQGHPNFTSLLLPSPGSDSLITLMHIGIDSVNSNIYHLFFSIVNKTLNNGFGDLIIRDSLIYTGGLSSFKLASVKHANGRDWWVFTYDYTLGAYVYFLLTPYGISLQGTQSIGSPNTCLYYGKLIFSNDGTKLMAVGGYYGCVDVFDFDRCTGLLSNFRDIGEHLADASHLEYKYYNCSFSPNGNIIYVSPNWYDVMVIYQWDLNAASIPASKTLLNQYPDTGMHQGTTYFQHKLAPDGKIYIPITSNYGSWYNTFYTHHLDVIENPDVPGFGCNYVRQAFDLGNHFVTGEMPNIPYYNLGPMPGSACDTVFMSVQTAHSEKEKGVEVFPNPTTGIFNLKLKDGNDKIAEVTVQNVFGKEVLHQKYFSSSFNLSNEPAGVYFVHVVTQKKKVLSVKLVKE